MIDFIDLDVATATGTKQLNWVTDCIVIRNNTPYPLYVNWRSTKIPSIIAYDELIPGGMYQVVAAIGNNFGFLLDTSGSTFPAVGKKCSITFQKDEIIPNFSQANFRSSFTIPYTLTVGTPVLKLIINVAGAQALSIAIQELLDHAFVNVSVSNDGVDFVNYRSYIVKPDETLIRVYPASVNYYLIEINRGTSDIVGTFTFSLMNYYADVPVTYSNELLAANAATLAPAANIQTNYLFSAAILDYIGISVQGITGGNTFAMTIQVIDASTLPIATYTLDNITAGGAGNVVWLGQGQPYLMKAVKGAGGINRTWRIPVNLQFTRMFRLRLTNSGSTTLTNPSIVGEYRREL